MYFQKFPYTVYQFPDNVKRNIKNLSLRPNIVAEYIEDGSNLEEYIIQDGETPETIAFDLYENVNDNWIIMMVNNVFSLYNDWPKSSSELQSFLMEKYRVQEDSDGLPVTQSDKSVLEYLEFVGLASNKFFSTNDDKVALRPHHFVDADGLQYSYETVIGSNTDVNGREYVLPEVTPVSHYDYEFELNEQKRTILVPSRDTVVQMNRELGNLLSE